MLKLFKLLPARVQRSLYFRFLWKFRARFKRLYDMAPLRLAPGVRMKLSHLDLYHGQIAFMGAYEEELSNLVLNLAACRGGLMIDVGANYGYFSLLWCAGNKKSRSTAIEASPANLPALKLNLEMNGFSDRVEVLSWAASRAAGEACFDLGSSEETGWGGLSKDVAAGSITVQTRRLDQEFSGRLVELLKIDCEGADFWVLEGAEGLLKSGLVKHVVFEENIYRQEKLGIPEGEAVRLLTKNGYSCQQMGSDPWIKSYQASLKTD